MFHVEPSELARLTAGELFTLSGDEGFHAATVQRLEAGESVLLADGMGRLAHGTVVEVLSKDQLVVSIIAITEAPQPTPRLIVVQAIPKGDRAELAVELGLQFGIVGLDVRGALQRGPGRDRPVQHRLALVDFDASRGDLVVRLGVVGVGGLTVQEQRADQLALVLAELAAQIGRAHV